MAVHLEAPHPDLSLPLLVEPIKPTEKHGTTGTGAYGWKRTTRVEGRGRFQRIVPDWQRNPEHDRHGALVQHIIAWYVLCDVDRGTLARRFMLSARQVQAYISGTGYRMYAQAVLGTLDALGISRGRGRWQGHRDNRPLEIARAAITVLQDADDLIRQCDPDSTAIAQVHARTRLLSVRWPG